MKLTETIYLEYLDFLLKGDRDKCVLIVDKLLRDNTDPVELYENLFKRSMYMVGKLWDKNQITIAEEHIASNITDMLVDVVSSKLKKAKKENKKIIITCVEKEFHCIGAKIIADYFEFVGWDVIMPGSNTPVNEVIKLIEVNKPDLIGISNSFYLNLIRLVKYIEAIKEKYPCQKIIIGGQALADGRDDLIEKYEDVKYIPSIETLENYLIKL